MDMPASSQAQASSNGITAAQAAPGKAPEAASGQSKVCTAGSQHILPPLVACTIFESLRDGGSPRSVLRLGCAA